MHLGRDRRRSIGLVALVTAAALGAVNLPRSFAAPVTKVPQLTVELAVQGASAPSTESLYPLEVTCTNSGRAGSLVKKIELRAGKQIVLGAADLPGLTLTDMCSVRATLEGAQTRYSSTNADRVDGSSPPNSGGVIYGPGYVSAKTQANGQTITVTHAFVGDLVVGKLVLGAPLVSVGRYQVQVRCDDSGFLQTVSLANNQTQLVTGIPVGSVCSVTEPNTPGVRFEDNSGIPSDGVITIVASPSSCWDLRNADPSCRVLVTSVHTYGAIDQAQDGSLNTIPDDEQTTSTTLPSDQATPAAAAAVEEPAQLLSEESTTDGIAYTG